MSTIIRCTHQSVSCFCIVGSKAFPHYFFIDKVVFDSFDSLLFVLLFPTYHSIHQHKMRPSTIGIDVFEIVRSPALVMYIFTQDKKLQDLFIHGTRSGSMCLNDTIMQYAGKSCFQQSFRSVGRNTLGDGRMLLMSIYHMLYWCWNNWWI